MLKRTNDDESTVTTTTDSTTLSNPGNVGVIVTGSNTQTNKVKGEPQVSLKRSDGRDG